MLTQHTTMALAFSNIRAPYLASRLKLACRIGDSLERYERNRKPMKGWTARLSYRTARMLASKGVPLQ